MPPKDLFDLLEDSNDLTKSDIEVYLSSVREVIVEKKDPYYTLVKTKIHDLIDSEESIEQDYIDSMLNRLTGLKSVYTSEFVLNTIDIFAEFVQGNRKTALSKEGILYLNELWKSRP